MTHIFDDVIYTYTRNNMLEDGFIIDVTTSAKAHGFKIPVGITKNVWDEFIEIDKVLEDNEVRLNNILQMAFPAAKNNLNVDRVYFKVMCVNGNNGILEEVSLIMSCGPADDLTPCITIMCSDDD